MNNGQNMFINNSSVCYFQAAIHFPEWNYLWLLMNKAEYAKFIYTWSSS
jgi:hypothetical protein